MAGKSSTTIDFGSTPVSEASFTITDANITATTVVEPFVLVDSTIDNDQDSHRHAAASWKLAALPATGSFTLYITCLLDMCNGTFKVQYAYA